MRSGDSDSTALEEPAPSAGDLPDGRGRLARAPSALNALLARLQTIDIEEGLLLSSLLALCALVKTLWLQTVNIFWDAGAYWHFARQWSYHNDFTHARWTHHMARVGLTLPAHLVQRLFGTNPPIYYVLPVASFTLQTLFVYLLSRRLSGRIAGVFGALFMTFSTGMTTTASQLLPDGIAATAAIIAAYTLVRFHEELGAKRWRWLIATGLACCWAYAIKESSVLLFPGVALAVFFSRRSFKEAFVLVGVIGGYGALETLCIRLFTPYAHRMAIIQQGHGFYPPLGFWDLFDRFTKLDPPSAMLFWMFAITVLYHAGSDDRRRRLFVILPVGFVFFLTFLVRRVNPIIPWESFKARYMAPGMALFVVGVAVFFGDAVHRAWARWEGPSWRKVAASLSSAPGHWTFAVCTLLGVGMYLTARPAFAHHPIAQLRRDADVLNDAFRRNLPIVERSRVPHGLNTIYAIYLRPKYLAQSEPATAGRLPDIQEGVHCPERRERYGFILRDATVYESGDLERLIKEGCAVTVVAQNHVRLGTSETLPAECKAPRGRALAP